ncbi:MAG TPA: redoxin domain-containing protein [Gemmatimonadaceae bacterium]|nr:redoxin domain-containing protein [Gemmatimonadaceae bacterium]
MPLSKLAALAGLAVLIPFAASRRVGAPGGRTADVRPASTLPDYGPMPELSGATGWLNSPPLTRAGLKGKVVLVDFWTFACINCRHVLPYVKQWAAKYQAEGLVVLSVHTPELPEERVRTNLEKAVKDLGIVYPVAIDNNSAIWNAFQNEYWPAYYFVDRNGRIRGHYFGEGNYPENEALIKTLLAEPANR